MKVTILRHFYAVFFKLSVKNKTGKSQRVRDKAYKIVNLISRCASIISMDISMDLSMDIHIHGKPGEYVRLTDIMHSVTLHSVGVITKLYFAIFCGI